MASIRITEEDGVRFLQFGAHWIQGAMRIARPWALELEYTRAMMFPLLLRGGAWPRNVLTVGLGAGSLVKFLYRHRPRARITAVEIDPEVAITAWQCFRLPEESGRLVVELGDGYRHVARARERYDLILVDGFDASALAGRLDSAAFYRNCRARLAEGGILSVNLLSKRGPPTASLRRLRSAFADRVLELPRIEVNTVVLAGVGAPTRMTTARLHASALALRARAGLDLSPALAGLAEGRRGETEISL